MVCADDIRHVAAGDGHPLVFGALTVPLTRAVWNNAENFKTFIDYGGGGETWGTCGYVYPLGNNTWYRDMPGSADMYDGKERPLPLYALDQTTGGYLGQSRWFHAASISRQNQAMENQTVLAVDDVSIIGMLDGSTFLGCV